MVLVGDLLWMVDGVFGSYNIGAFVENCSSKSMCFDDVLAGIMWTSISVDIRGWMKKFGNASVVLPASA